jgi:ferredoxin
LEHRDFQHLLDALVKQGYQLAGPTLRDGVIAYDELASAEDLPAGWTDQQEPGAYRLIRRTDEAYFGYVACSHSLKKFLHPPVLRLWSARRNGDGVEIVRESDGSPPFAFIGVRSCELHAMAVQDKVLRDGDYADPVYALRRAQAFIMAVNCSEAGGTCFCASMQTGPGVTSGFDLALTEVIEAGLHYFVVEVGTERGGEVLRAAPHRPARGQEEAAAERVVSEAARRMGRSLDTTDLEDLLCRNYENSRWDDIASRCQTCGNCTMVCPTCFCTTVEDVTDLTGGLAERRRKWDSCFTMDFSYIHGGSVRSTASARYRHWMIHKLATWADQFGVAGCVGCGRCITWCPVGIDITEEARAIRESERTKKGIRST